MKLVGLSEQEASDWAYLASEVINWEWMLQILKAAEVGRHTAGSGGSDPGSHIRG